ncbi:hypothetical protein [Pseudomonas bubulae]|uniref:hypothetical protein n=1 Tax=Pseudomonas bubulae TaxID=2316085 RepID=UPI001F1AEC11|nr:hypothetical protein [Pseudomonas bubulae]MCF3193447.1 hypothetical protein [Pseudomonas bubulae]
MKRLLGMVVLVGIIAGAYVIVTTYTQGNDFKEKSVQLMVERGAKIIDELDKYPGCADRFELQSTSFDKDNFFSNTATARSIYTDRNNSLLDIKWTAEIVNEGRLIIVQPKDPAGLQATLSAMLLSSCRGM